MVRNNFYKMIFVALFVMLQISLIAQPQADTVPLPEREAPYGEQDDAPEQNLSDEELLEQNLLNGGVAKDKIEPELQRNFFIIDSPHTYNLNPHTASYSSEAQILTSLYDGLFSYHPVTLEPVNALASQFRISRDKKRWTFTIREGAKFSDNSPITAAVVRDAWLDLLAEPLAPYASMLDIIDGAAAYRTGTGKRNDVRITAVDDVTLVVHLVSSAGYFPRILCHSAFAVCKKDLSAFSGAFCIKSRKEGELVLAKNNNYWDAENTYLEQITIAQSDDVDANAYAFNTGRADWITGGADIHKLLGRDVTQINAEFATEYLFFKCRKDSIWNNPDFRLALLEAVPWEKLREQAFVKAATLVYPINGYPHVEGFAYTDKNEALALMKAARKKAGIPEDEMLTLVFAILDSNYMKQEAELLIDAWAPLGVDVQIQSTPSERYLESIPSWNADLFSYTWIGDFADPLAFLELFRSDSTLNVSEWKHNEYDKLLAEAARYTESERTKLLAQAEQILLDDGIVLPISHPVSLNIIDLEAVGGWSANAFDIHPFKYMYKKRKAPAIPNVVMRLQ